MFEYPFPFMPPDLSTHGGEIDAMIWWLHILMAILFVGWGTFFICTLVKFRAGKNTKANPEAPLKFTPVGSLASTVGPLKIA